MKEDCKIDPTCQEKINQISQELDQIFEKLKETFINIIDEECKKAKSFIEQKFTLNNEYIIILSKNMSKFL